MQLRFITKWVTRKVTLGVTPPILRMLLLQGVCVRTHVAGGLRVAASCSGRDYAHTDSSQELHRNPRPSAAHVHKGYVCFSAQQLALHSSSSLASMILSALSRAVGSAARACGQQCASSASWPAQSNISTVLLCAFSKLGAKDCAATGWSAFAEHGAVEAHKVIACSSFSWSARGPHAQMSMLRCRETQASKEPTRLLPATSMVYLRCHAFNRPFLLGYRLLALEHSLAHTVLQPRAAAICRLLGAAAWLRSHAAARLPAAVANSALRPRTEQQRAQAGASGRPAAA